MITYKKARKYIHSYLLSETNRKLFMRAGNLQIYSFCDVNRINRLGIIAWVNRGTKVITIKI